MSITLFSCRDGSSDTLKRICAVTYGKVNVGDNLIDNVVVDSEQKKNGCSETC